MQEEQATEATLQRMLHGGRQCRRRTFCREQWYSLSLSLTLIRVLTFALRSRKSRGEQAAWRPVASEANPLYCRPTRQGVFRRTDLRVLIEEPLNIIYIVCEAKTGGGEGAPTTCYTISIDYVMLRIKCSDGDVGTMQLCRIISPVGLGALQDVSL